MLFLHLTSVSLFLLSSLVIIFADKDQETTWLPHTYPDLKRDLTKCSRVAGRQLSSVNGYSALVCDPDEMFSVDETLSLEKELRELLSTPVKFNCPCSTVNDLYHVGAPVFRRNCPPETGDDRFMVAVAVMRKMAPSHIREFGSKDKVNGRLRAARNFAEQLKKKWFKGVTRCGELFIILYSAEDKVLYVATGQAAHEKVSNQEIKDILVQVRPIFPGDPIAGIRHVFNRLKYQLTEFVRS